jgi:hypothetical protein
MKYMVVIAKGETGYGFNNRVKPQLRDEPVGRASHARVMAGIYLFEKYNNADMNLKINTKHDPNAASRRQ